MVEEQRASGLKTQLAWDFVKVDMGDDVTVHRSESLSVTHACRLARYLLADATWLLLLLRQSWKEGRQS